MSDETKITNTVSLDRDSIRIDFQFEGDNDQHAIEIGQQSDRFYFSVTKRQYSENYKHEYSDEFELPNIVINKLMDFLATKNWTWEHPKDAERATTNCTQGGEGK